MYNEHLKICEIEYTPPKIEQIVILFTMLAKLLSKPASKIDHFTIQTDVRINQLRMRIETLEQRSKSDPLNLNAKIDRLEGILRSLETPIPYKIDQDGEK